MSTCRSLSLRAISNGKFFQYDPKGSSQTTVLGVQGTFINGINDEGNIVGFFSLGVSALHGFVDSRSEVAAK